MYALLSKKLVEESKRYQYLKTEVKQSNANGILPNSLNIAKLVLVLLAPSIYLQKWICNLSQGSTDDSLQIKLKSADLGK